MWGCVCFGFMAGFSFVPSKIPRKRRLQTMAVAAYSTMIVTTTFIFLMLW